MRRTFALPGPLNLRLTLGPLRHGRDATIAFDGTGAWRATRTPCGPATVHLAVDGERVRAEAWGAGAEWALDSAPELVGAHDDVTGFRPAHPRLAGIARRLRGLRMCKSRAVVETLVPTIIEQKVVASGAHASYRRLVYRFSDPAPGPRRLRLPPDPDVLATLPYYELHRLGIERRRADAIRRACSYAHRLEETTTLDMATAYRRLRALPGIGAWTAALVAGIALGDTDAVEPGDFHLPHTICWFLAGEARGTDERMLELLEPYRGQRARVIRLIEASGAVAPRFGPGLRMQSIEAM